MSQKRGSNYYYQENNSLQRCGFQEVISSTESCLYEKNENYKKPQNGELSLLMDRNFYKIENTYTVPNAAVTNWQTDNIVSTPWLQGGWGFSEILFGAGKFLVYRVYGPLGGLQNLEGAEDFDEFYKNTMKKF